MLGATCVTWKVGTVLPHLSTTVVLLHDCTRLCLQTQLGSLSHVMLIHDDHDVVAMDHVRKLQICIIINLQGMPSKPLRAIDRDSKSWTHASLASLPRSRTRCPPSVAK